MPFRRWAQARDAGYSSLISFERTDTERAIARWWGELRRLHWGRRVRRRRCVLNHLVEKRRGWCKEKAAGDGSAEVENTVIVAGGPADEHVFQHLFDRARRSAVTDKVGSEFAPPDLAERH